MVVSIPLKNKSKICIQDGLVGQRYRLVNPDGSVPESVGENVEVLPIGEGGFGCVVRARDPLKIDRAIKFVAPPRGDPDATNLFKVEISLSNAIPFKNLISVIDYGIATEVSNRTLGCSGRDWGFLVSPYVQGITFRDFFQKLVFSKDAVLTKQEFRDRAHDLVLVLIGDLLSGLVELDAAKVVHMDLKPNNLLIYPSIDNPLGIGPSRNAKPIEFGVEPCPTLRSFIIDLGAAKPISEELNGRTSLRTTKFWFPDHLKSDLGYDASDGTIDYAGLKKYWREIDIYSSGRIVEWMLLNRVKRNAPGIEPNPTFTLSEEMKEALWNEIFGDDFPIIEGIVDDMVQQPHCGFHSAAEVKLKFDTIEPKMARSVFASEALTDKHPGIRLRTAQSLVRVSLPFDRLVNHPAFQRLKLIPQLAFVSEIFPDGTHTRFSHSLRTFHLAKQFVLGLGRKSRFRLLFGKDEVNQLLAAALLHDVGQYHFSHSIEDLKKLGDLCDDAKLKPIRHDQELAKIMLGKEDIHGVSLRKILEDHNLSIDGILYAFQKTKKNYAKPLSWNITRDIISGTIDVDRVSYLMHDSERTGVPYGRAIDVGSLVEALTIRWEKDQPEKSGLAIEEHGVSAVEAVLAAVYWMYRNVYWRHTNRAFMACVKYVMFHLLKSGRLAFNTYVEQTQRQSAWQAVSFLHREFERIRPDLGGVNPLDDLLNLRRVGYKRAFTLQYGLDSLSSALYERIAISITPALQEELLREVIRFLSPTKIENGEVLIDVPLKPRLGKAREGTETINEEDRRPRPPIWVCCRGQLSGDIHWTDLEGYSLFAAEIGNIEQHARRIRIFFSRSLVERVEPFWSKIEKEMLSFIDGKTKDWQSRPAIKDSADATEKLGSQTA